MDFVLFLGHRLNVSPHQACQRLERALENYKPRFRYPISVLNQNENACEFGQPEPNQRAQAPN